MLDEIKPALSYIHTFKFKTERGTISHRYQTDKGLISLLHPCAITKGKFQIYCIEGNLFKETKNFKTLEEAEAEIAYLLL